MQRYGLGGFHEAAKIQSLKCIFEYNLSTGEVPNNPVPNFILPLCVRTVYYYHFGFISMSDIVFSIGENQRRKYHVQVVQDFWRMVV